MVFLFHFPRACPAHLVKKVKMEMSAPWYVWIFKYRIDLMGFHVTNMS